MPENLNPTEFGTEEHPLIVKPEKPFEKPIDLLTWQAHTRIFKPRNPVWFLSLMIITIFVLIALVLLGQWTLTLAVVALVFVLFSVNLIEPKNQDYIITTLGLKLGPKTYEYDDLKWFWFDKSEEQEILYVSTYLNFPHLLEIPLSTENTQDLHDRIEAKLLKYLPYHEEKTRDVLKYLDRLILRISPWLPNSMVDWYTNKFKA